MPIWFPPPFSGHVLLRPEGVLVDEIDNFSTCLLFALAIAVHGVEPVHVEDLRGEVALGEAGGKSLQN